MRQPREIGALSATTMNRMVALCFLMLMVTCVVSARMGIVNFNGPVMSACIVSGCLASLVLVGNRTTYLPFLGEAAFPSSLLREPGSPDESTVEVEVRAEPGATHVAYWASEIGEGVKKNPWIAYGSYKNSGIAVVRNGKATLNLRCPSIYTVRGKVLPRHVHYRSVFESGIVGKVETRGVVCT